MTNEHVEELYSKFEKNVAKNEREGLKTSLENCDNEKYENLKKLELKSKSPLKELAGLIGWVASLFGCFFLIFNLVVYACVVPMNTDNIQFATKLGNDMSEYAQIATYEIKDAYSDEYVLWLTDKVLELNSSEYNYETLSKDLTSFENAYKTFKTALDAADKAYKNAIANAKSEDEKISASLTLQTAANDAETVFINGIKNLPVLDGTNIDTTYSSYKTELNKYHLVLRDTSSTKEAIAEARITFDESSAKTNFDNLLITVRDYISKAKTVINIGTELTEYKSKLEKYAKDLDEYKKKIAEGKDASKPVKPEFLAGIAEYFGDEKEHKGAIQELKSYYNAYVAAGTEYEKNMSSVPDESTLLWWSSPISHEINRTVIGASDLVSYQNGFVDRLNIYKAVINGLPDRLEDISNYYGSDGIYQYNSYNEDKGEVLFSYFMCTTKTMRSVLDKTDFEVNKNSFGKITDNFEKFNYAININSDGYLSEDFNSELLGAANSAVGAINDFDGAVVGMTNIASQTNTLVKGYQSDTDMLSIILMVYDIVLAVVLGVYWLTLVLIHRSKAQAENLKAINELISK